MKWHIDRKIAAAFTVALCSVGMLGVLTYTNMTSFVKSSRWASHAQTVLAELDAVPLKREESESAELQYFLTKDAQYRTAFQTGVTGGTIEHAISPPDIASLSYLLVTSSLGW
jgi:CHASE3 domain sensor protein